MIANGGRIPGRCKPLIAKPHEELQFHCSRAEAHGDSMRPAFDCDTLVQLRQGRITAGRIAADGMIEVLPWVDALPPVMHAPVKLSMSG
jgi:hypothetical protein